MSKSPIEIKTEFGRCLFSREPVTRGSLLVEEFPFALGPKHNSEIVCLGCYRKLPDFGDDGYSEDRCSVCDWPLCLQCVNAEDHRGECEIFARARMTFAGNVTEDGVCTQLDCITPLRVLLTKESQPERWEKEVACMEYHDEERRANEDVWNADRINIAQYLRGPCQLAEKFSEDLIMKVIGILEVNAFEARTKAGAPLRCLYPITGILAHSCVPNTMRSIYPSENYKIRLRAMVDLEAGEQLLHSYTYTLDGTAQRQSHLKSGKYFTCKCRRCLDPSELGINFSTLKCSKCSPDGWLRPLDPLDTNTYWKCANCSAQVSHSAVQELIGVLQAEVEAVQSKPIDTHRLERTEELIEKYGDVLHPNHFINFSLYLNLVEMYGRVKNYEMNTLSMALMERKAKLCELALKVLDAYEPGISRTKAIIIYELHVPIVLMAKKSFEEKSITNEEFAEKIQIGITLLKDSVDILQHEDESSYEGMLGKIANTALMQLLRSHKALTSEEF